MTVLPSVATLEVDVICAVVAASAASIAVVCTAFALESTFDTAASESAATTAAATTFAATTAFAATTSGTTSCAAEEVKAPSSCADELDSDAECADGVGEGNDALDCAPCGSSTTGEPSTGRESASSNSPDRNSSNSSGPSTLCFFWTGTASGSLCDIRVDSLKGLFGTKYVAQLLAMATFKSSYVATSFPFIACSTSDLKRVTTVNRSSSLSTVASSLRGCASSSSDCRSALRNLNTLAICKKKPNHNTAPQKKAKKRVKKMSKKK